MSPWYFAGFAWNIAHPLFFFHQFVYSISMFLFFRMKFSIIYLNFVSIFFVSPHLNRNFLTIVHPILLSGRMRYDRKVFAPPPKNIWVFLMHAIFNVNLTALFSSCCMVCCVVRKFLLVTYLYLLNTYVNRYGTCIWERTIGTVIIFLGTEDLMFLLICCYLVVLFVLYSRFYECVFVCLFVCLFVAWK
jgi:hypothetical protein